MSQWKQMHMMRGTRLRFLGAVMLLLAGSNATAALEFDMNDSTRCFEEEIHEQVLVVGEYAVFAFREQISNVLRSLNATTSDREHVGFLKQRDVDELVSELEPNKNLTNVSDDEQEEQVVHYFQTREENFLRLHEDDPKAVLEFQRQAHDVVEKFSLREMFLGLVHQRVHLPLQLTVTDPDGKQIISRTDDTESAFTFDAKRAGIYECCIRVLDDPRRGWSLVNNRGKKVTLEQLVGFLSSAGSPMKVKMNWKVGIQTAEWESKARSTNLQVISQRLTDIDSAMREVEAEMQRIMGLNKAALDTAEAHEKLISNLGMVSMCIVACLSLAQIFFLKLFFKKKKII